MEDKQSFTLTHNSEVLPDGLPFMDHGDQSTQREPGQTFLL